MLVKTLMRTPAVTIAEDEPIGRARELMLREGQTDLVVVRHGKPVGMLSEREARLVLTPSNDRSDWQALCDHLPVENVMTPSTLTVSAGSSVGDAISRLCASREGSLPVVQDGEIVGLITISDLLGLLGNLLEPRQ